MIQGLIKGWKKALSFDYKWTLLLVIYTILIEIALMHKFPISSHNIDNLLGHLLTFSSIVVAILIAYIITKVFQLRNEKLESQKIIIELGNKVTHFRRICKILKDCDNFWPIHVRRIMKDEYRGLNFNDVHDLTTKVDSETFKLREKYWQDEDANTAISDLYLCVDVFCQEDRSRNLELYDQYDHDFVYTLEILKKWTNNNVANQLWYWFDHKYIRIQNSIHFKEIRPYEKKQILELSRKINMEKYGSRDIDKSLFADLGTDFDGFYLPKLLKYSIENSKGLPSVLNFILRFNKILIVIGVLAPIILLSLNLPLEIKLITAYSIVIAFSILIVIFLVRFNDILEKEVHVLYKR